MWPCKKRKLKQAESLCRWRNESGGHFVDKSGQRHNLKTPEDALAGRVSWSDIVCANTPHGFVMIGHAEQFPRGNGAKE